MVCIKDLSVVSIPVGSMRDAAAICLFLVTVCELASQTVLSNQCLKYVYQDVSERHEWCYSAVIRARCSFPVSSLYFSLLQIQCVNKKEKITRTRIINN